MGGASRDSTGFGALEEGLISSCRRNLRVPLTSDSDRKVPADLGQESQASSWVEATIQKDQYFGAQPSL